MGTPHQEVVGAAAAPVTPEVAMSGEGHGDGLEKDGAVEVPWEGPAGAQVCGVSRLRGVAVFSGKEARVLLRWCVSWGRLCGWVKILPSKQPTRMFLNSFI